MSMSLGETFSGVVAPMDAVGCGRNERALLIEARTPFRYFGERDGQVKRAIGPFRSGEMVTLLSNASIVRF